MFQTYKATLNGNQLEWSGEVPDIGQNGKSVSVFITILDDKTVVIAKLQR